LHDLLAGPRELLLFDIDSAAHHRRVRQEHGEGQHGERDPPVPGHRGHGVQHQRKRQIEQLELDVARSPSRAPKYREAGSVTTSEIVTRGEGGPAQFVEAELLGAGDLDDAVRRRADGDRGHCGHDVVGRDRLDEHRCEAYGVAVRGGVDDALDELEGACCVARVEDRGRLEG
jgi:hypothetical protein